MSKESLKNEDIMKLFGSIKYSKKKDLMETFESVLEYVEECENEKESAKKTLAEYDKDVEIQKLKDEIKELKTKKK